MSYPPSTDPSPPAARGWVREPFNTYSHAAGIALGLGGTLVLALLAEGNPLKLVGALVFGLTMTLMYASSTLYHALHVSQKALAALRRLDHAAIFLFIAGTYTPLLLQALEPSWRPWTLGGVWGLAGLGVLFRVFALKAPRWMYVLTYLGLGWLSVFLIPKLTLGPWSLAFLILGGAAYSIGAIIYGLKRPNPLPAVVGFHGIWHLLVLVGSIGMYLAVLMVYVA
ncbi:PAQR family membrane homeostasis protein TrhA [Meiothermus granaticius]|uniref:Channel protein, hemolysin III family n=1 Tax=Meiothermus granaticius NBRC 107808 TaxID=1227551 RepID=A0A399FC87_9DEIN|nr:hemolysin III family protein [Meiothermus granaticius]RIH92261.1 channel protein, hemolysin III family [Meiothermus granaticius NBRC 107808]GEM86471.1 hemolysin [Meiothermus granaticius NBRC 107808]